LCGVRDPNVPLLSEPRGYPTNVSERTKMEIDRWVGDGHSHSWNTLAELRNHLPVLEQYVSEFGDDDKSYVVGGYEYLLKSIDERIEYLDYHINSKTPPEDIRIVYWFDN